MRFAERFPPGRDPRDSGWAFWAGTEGQAYMDNAHNLRVVAMAELLARHPELDAVLEAPVGALFAREGERFLRER